MYIFEKDKRIQYDDLEGGKLRKNEKNWERMKKMEGFLALKSMHVCKGNLKNLKKNFFKICKTQNDNTKRRQKGKGSTV